MEHRGHSLDEETLTAERAAEWLFRVEAADAREQERFLNWLRRSPQHGGELLIATSTDIAMRQLFRNKRIDVEQFLAASANVLKVDDRALVPQQPARGKRLRLIAVASLSGAVATTVLFITPALLRNWIYPCELGGPVGEQRAVELLDRSAMAIDADADLLVTFSANARDIDLGSGPAMFRTARDSTRPLVHVVTASGGVDPSAAGAAMLPPVGSMFDMRHRSDRGNFAAIEHVMLIRARPPVTVLAVRESPSVVVRQPMDVQSTGTHTAPTPMVMDRNGNDVLIRLRSSLTHRR